MTWERPETDTPTARALGCALLTRDGREVGRVAEVSQSSLKIIGNEAEYWLDHWEVERIGESALMVASEDAELALDEEHLQSVAASEEYVDFEARPVFSHEDAQRQREHMEAEVHRQARSLDPSAVHPMHRVPGAAPTWLREQDRTRGATLRLEDLLELREHPLLAADGQEVGLIRDVILDESTMLPEWVAIETGGPLRTRWVLAPIFGSCVLGDTISVPYLREQVVASRVEPTALTLDAMRALREHYGLPAVRKQSAA
jgi:sporulation protein YlmC with PRC-barrel domain